MPMRGELSIPAMSTGQRMRPAESTWLQVFGIFRSPDLAVVVVLGVISIVASLSLALLFPFAQDVTAFLAQAS
jgi:hypothetical protein